MLRYHTINNVYGGKMVFVELNNGDMPDPIVIKVMGILCKWGGFSSKSEKYISWEVTDIYIEGVERFLNHFYSKDENAIPDWM